MITLSGTDPNSGLGGNALSTWILSVPSAGQLYQTADGLTPGQQITSSNLPALIINAQFSVIYVNTFANTALNGLAKLNNDSFIYQPRVTYNQSSFASATNCQLPRITSHRIGCSERWSLTFTVCWICTAAQIPSPSTS